MSKMTDEQIIKALECCFDGGGCKCCPLINKPHCLEDVVKEATNLINRQKAEIERLEETKNRLSYNLQAVLDERADHSKAVKEFAERLKEKQQTFIGDEYAYKFIYLIEIDNLVKEMVGEDNG